MAPPILPSHFCTETETLDKTPWSKTPTIEKIILNPKTKNKLLIKILHCFGN